MDEDVRCEGVRVWAAGDLQSATIVLLPRRRQ